VLKLVRELDPPGRFLRKSGNGTFVQVPTREAREKVCQTLRDAVSEANTTSRSSNVTQEENQSDVEDGGDDDGEEFPSKMPPLLIKEGLVNDPFKHPLPIKQEPIDDQHFEDAYEYNVPSERLPLEAETSLSTISPDKVPSSRFDVPATVTPSNQTTEDASLYVVTSSNQIEEASPPLMLPDNEMGYDAYNYLSRVGIHDDFDLFDGELLKTAKHDEVFASMRL
jgi:hypothetical protein